MTRANKVGVLPAILFVFIANGRAAAQPSEGQDAGAQPSGEQTPPAPGAQLERSFEQLRQLRDQTDRQIAALLEQLRQQQQQQQQQQEPATGGAAAPSADVAQLRTQIGELRQQLEAMQAQMQEQHDSILEDIERRTSLSGITSHYLRIPQHGHPYVRAFNVILLLNAQIAPRLRFYGEIEFEDDAGAGDSGGARGDDLGAVAVEQGYGELTIFPALAVRLGVVLVPFGGYNRRHEEWRQSFSTRPLVSEAIFPSTYSDAGAELLGTLVRSESFQLSYEIAAVNGLTSRILTEAGGEGLRNALPAFGDDNNGGKSILGRLGLSIGEHLELGASGYWGPYANDGEGRAAITMGGLDAWLTFTHFVTRAEGIYVRLDEGSAMVDDDEDPATPPVLSSFPRSMAGFSVESELQFWPAFMRHTPLGEFDEPVFFLAGRLDVGRIEFPMAHVQTELKLSGAFGYRPVPRSAIRVEFAKGWGDFELGNDWLTSVSFALGF